MSAPPVSPKSPIESMSGANVCVLIRLSAKKMNCRVCGKSPCAVVLVSATKTEGGEALAVTPGYCRKHTPKDES